MGRHTEVAKLIRKYLKENKIPYTSVKSKTYSGGDSVTISLYDANPEQVKQVEIEADRYEIGTFNGMTDSYEYNNRNKDIPQVKFTFVNVEFSDKMKQKALDELHKEYPEGYVEVPELYSECNSATTDESGDYVTTEVQQVLACVGGINKNVSDRVWGLVQEEQVDEQGEVESPIVGIYVPQKKVKTIVPCEDDSEDNVVSHIIYDFYQNNIDFETVELECSRYGYKTITINVQDYKPDNLNALREYVNKFKTDFSKETAETKDNLKAHCINIKCEFSDNMKQKAYNFLRDVYFYEFQEFQYISFCQLTDEHRASWGNSMFVEIERLLLGMNEYSRAYKQFKF